MNDKTDQQLLCDYAERQSEAAFAIIVQRYVDLVYSAAFRMVCDAHAAKDVTQSVFVALSQNARQLTDRPALTGWLHGTARNLAAKTVRSEVRRRAREQEAIVMNELLSANPDIRWENIAPHLDDALSELSEPDRDAVLLRYFKNHDLRTVGATLGISDDAAQKRVSRAVERLREFFAKRGVTVGAGGLAVVISANAVQTAPAGLAITISAAAVLTGTTLATTATVTATKAIAMTALQKTIVTAAIAVLAGAGIYEARQAAQLRDQVQTLQQQQVPQSKRVAELNQTLIKVTNELAALRDDNERLNQNTKDLLRLRGEVTQLKAAKNYLASLAKSNNPMVTEIEFWLSRVELIKQRLSILPEKQIPEFQFMPEREWMIVAQYLNVETNLDDVVDYARNYAKKNCGLAFHEALQKYMAANDQNFPPDLHSLQSYLPRLSDPSVFQNYQITPAMIKTETDPDNGVERQAYRPCQGTTNSEWIIMQKASLYDADIQVVVTSSGLRYQNFPTK